MQLLNPEFILTTFGVLGLFAIIFAESGLFIGFFFPGDSLLFTAGFLAPFLGVNIYFLAIGAFVCAVLGDNTGYWFGKKIGPKLFSKKDSFFFKKENAIRAQKFFNQHGAKSIVLARFMPVVRTFVPILAGVGSMDYAIFLKWNVFGGFIWGVGVTSAGYFLGRAFPNTEHYLSYIVGAIVVVSMVPIVWQLWKEYKKS